MNDPFKTLLEPIDEKSSHTAPVKLADTSGRYRLGPAVRPTIKHDNGFLDKFPRREPTAADRAALLKWKAKLAGSEALCNARTGKYLDDCSHEDLSDANAAYHHFLYGGGKDRIIDYEKYLREDPAAVDLIKNVMNDFRSHAEVIGKDRVRFSVTSEPYTVGNGGIATYPLTANWQKAIGAHFLWVSADISVSAGGEGKIWYETDMIVHMEDRYNFNPGSTDIATGIPDSENGKFEISGLAKQYMNFATITRHIKWAEGERVNGSFSGTNLKKIDMPTNATRANKNY
jgi:hypothetical protein